MSYDDFRIADTRRFVATIEADLRGSGAVELDQIDGADATGSVHCVVRLDGELVRCAITDGWWVALGPQRVASAVLQALAYARDKAGIAQLVLARHGRSVPARAWRTVEADPEPSSDDLATRADLARRKLDRAAAALAEAEKLARRLADHSRREVAGPRGMFRVRLEGMRVIGASVTAPGLRVEDAAALAEDATAALRAARPTFSFSGE